MQLNTLRASLMGLMLYMTLVCNSHPLTIKGIQGKSTKNQATTNREYSTKNQTDNKPDGHYQSASSIKSQYDSTDIRLNAQKRKKNLNARMSGSEKRFANHENFEPETQAQNHKPQAVALSQEQPNDPIHRSQQQLDGSEFSGPFIMANGDNLVASNSMFGQPLATLPNAGSQEQLLAGFLVDGMGNQQMLGAPQVMSSHNMNSFRVSPQQQASPIVGDESYNMQQQNLYGPQGGYYPLNSAHLAQMGSNGPVQRYFRSQTSVSSPPARNSPFRKAAKLRAMKQQTSGGKLLTNGQINSLIDELKDYNRRQSKRMHSTGLVAPRNKNLFNLRDENTEIGPFLAKLENTLDGQETEESSQKEESPSTEDLAKFAKFLMTKEGANMRFQLGLDKDSPDDGDDEDDRDSLLESKAKHTKTKLKKNPKDNIEDFDRQHSEVAKQMEKLLNGMNKAKQAKRDQEEGSGEVEREEGEVGDRARKRREYIDILSGNPLSTDISITHTQSDNRRDHRAKNLEKGHHENVAKSLIEQEFAEDKLEAGGRELEKANREKSNIKVRDGKLPTISDSLIKSSGLKNEISFNPKRKRNTDHVALIHELQQARKMKSDTRSRIPMPLNSILRKALDGGLGIQASGSDDKGKVQLQTSTGAPLTLNVPKQSKVPIDTGSFDSELIPARLEPEEKAVQNVSIVKLQSEPLKDEYPISDRVSDRLNKLSDSLDQYFNDGFLKEIETKSQVGTKSDRQDDISKSNSNSTESTDKETNISNKVDHDFDVDVGIDGRRDVNREDDEDSGNLVDNNNKENGATPTTIRESTEILDTRGKKRAPSDKNKRYVRLANRRNRQISNVAQTNRFKKGDKRSELDGHANIKSNLDDPVESEYLETPIGPDSDV